MPEPKGGGDASPAQWLHFDPGEMTLEKDDYQHVIRPLKRRLSELQREADDAEVPIIILFEGWGGSGRGELMNELLLELDPRGYCVHQIRAVADEPTRPFLARFWMRTPKRGQIAIFDSSWYRRLIDERVQGKVSRGRLKQDVEEILTFERQLKDDGFVIAKLFMHLSKKEQKRRFKELEKSPATQWRVTAEDWKDHARYDEYLCAAEDALQLTHWDGAPWAVIASHDPRFAEVKALNTVIDAIEGEIHRRQAAVQDSAGAAPEDCAPLIVVDDPPIKLREVEFTEALPKPDYRKRKDKAQERIRHLMHLCYEQRVPVIIVYEGVDAAGKGGNIKRLVQRMDPRGYEVIPISAPDEDEIAHHYLWRFWCAVPEAGHFAIFDRSWYGRVLVERVEGFARPAEWQRAYAEINEFEQSLIRFGTVILKFWLQIDPDEQLRRFHRREIRPHKRWKMTDEDWRNREKWTQYQAAAEDMFALTSTDRAPWTVVATNDKRRARITVLEEVVRTLEKRLDGVD